jgi:membrane protein YqaA with SNARE-associated domain
MTPERRLTIARLLSLAFVIGVGVIILVNKDRVQSLAHFGYLGIFLITLIANATVIIPVPGVMVVFAMGAVFNPILTALAAGAGAALGELTGYMVGFSGQGLVENSALYERIRAWMVNNYRLRDLGIMVAAAIPNPFFDLAGIAAGTLKIPIWRFLLFCALGSILKMLAFALAGDTSLNWLFPR